LDESEFNLEDAVKPKALDHITLGVEEGLRLKY